LPFRKQQIEPQANIEQEIIEISSDEESKNEVTKEDDKFIALKKRSLSNSATGPPSKRRITSDSVDTAIEVLDSDDELEQLNAMKSVTMMTTTAAEKTASSSIETAKDRDGRYIVTQKVKVDSIENLLEVPARWPIPPEGINTAYVIDLNNDKKWQELDSNNKKKHLDRFIKQEVCLTVLHIFMSKLPI
jgi:hypothetical protein